MTHIILLFVVCWIFFQIFLLKDVCFYYFPVSIMAEDMNIEETVSFFSYFVFLYWSSSYLAKSGCMFYLSEFS